MTEWRRNWWETSSVSRRELLRKIAAGVGSLVLVACALATPVERKPARPRERQATEELTVINYDQIAVYQGGAIANLTDIPLYIPGIINLIATEPGLDMGNNIVLFVIADRKLDASKNIEEIVKNEILTEVPDRYARIYGFKRGVQNHKIFDIGETLEKAIPLNLPGLRGDLEAKLYSDINRAWVDFIEEEARKNAQVPIPLTVEQKVAIINRGHIRIPEIPQKVVNRHKPL